MYAKIWDRDGPVVYYSFNKTYMVTANARLRNKSLTAVWIVLRRTKITAVMHLVKVINTEVCSAPVETLWSAFVCDVARTMCFSVPSSCSMMIDVCVSPGLGSAAFDSSRGKKEDFSSESWCTVNRIQLTVDISKPHSPSETQTDRQMYTT